MRMWMVDPKILCRKHLLGEHVEMHMFLGHLKRKKKVDGYIKNNCLQMRSIFQRHEDLAKEMINRGYKHNSPMRELDFECIYDYPKEQIYHIVNTIASQNDLLSRCNNCYQRFIQIQNLMEGLTNIESTCRWSESGSEEAQDITAHGRRPIEKGFVVG